jgi:hypothetical protein
MGEKLCFVIAPIGDQDSEIRKRSDQVLNYIIKPVTKRCGYKAERADEISEPGIITTQVIQRLLDADLVIADLTGRNPNVFYELAIRHAIKKPVVQIIRCNEPIPFDVSTTRTIHFDHQNLESVDKCKEELQKQIHSVEKDPAKVDSPISVTIDLKALRQSKNPWEKSTAEIMSMLQDIWGEVQKGSLPRGKGAIFSPVVEEIENFFVDFAQNIVPILPKKDLIHFITILSRFSLKLKASEREYDFPFHALLFCINTMEKRLMQLEKESNGE